MPASPANSASSRKPLIKACTPLPPNLRVRWKTFENLTFSSASRGRYHASIVVKWRCPKTRQAAILAANLGAPRFEVKHERSCQNSGCNRSMLFDRHGVCLSPTRSSNQKSACEHAACELPGDRHRGRQPIVRTSTPRPTDRSQPSRPPEVSPISLRIYKPETARTIARHLFPSGGRN